MHLSNKIRQHTETSSDARVSAAQMTIESESSSRFRVLSPTCRKISGSCLESTQYTNNARRRMCGLQMKADLVNTQKTVHDSKYILTRCGIVGHTDGLELLGPHLQEEST